ARIGIVNPSYWLEPASMKRAVQVFEDLGYQLVLGKSTQLKENLYAGTPEQRAADIMAMFEDQTIDAIVCARGGYGGNRVLPLLDYQVIKNNPKIFVGYSDVTGYISSIVQQSGLTCFHGPMLSTYGKETIQYNLDTFFAVLSGANNIRIDSTAECPAKILKPGVATGKLWGGNLCLIMERLGTNDQIDMKGTIIFIEEIGEKYYSFDRMMHHLRNSGSLDNIRGLIIGEMVEMSDTKIPFGKNTDDIIMDICGDLDIPIISNFPCGHGDYQATLPIGHKIEIHAEDNNAYLIIPESPVK
ncbi:MAG: LD-carboxypeptidase, partial [Gammaproteobacteria bacterium]|nr:LD-carboxypeptidase [Gammaproteobacteria bacterium]